MTTHAEKAYELYKAAIGGTPETGEWFLVDQDRINAFADATDDHQFIHVDPEAAKLSPWGTTIAHGFLTLSLLVPLCATVAQDPKALEGIAMGLNYGFDKVRFINPVKVGSRVRASQVVSAVELKDANNVQITRTVTVEIEGESKPALVAEWITRAIYS